MEMTDDSIYKKLPLMLMVTLYNYNTIDNRIIAAVKNNSFILKKDENKIVIPASDLINLLKTKFKKEFDEACSFPQDRIAHGINTVYQLYHLINYYSELKVVAINISMDKSYSKVIDDAGIKYVALDYKIEKIIIRYDYHFNTKELKLFNSLLRDIKVIKTIRPHSTYSMFLTDFLNKIDSLSYKKKDKYKYIINFNKKAYPEKLKLDNPFLILITDFC